VTKTEFQLFGGKTQKKIPRTLWIQNPPKKKPPSLRHTPWDYVNNIGLIKQSNTQQISIILGNPPPSLPTKLHKAWTETTLNEFLPYISSLEALLTHDHSQRTQSTPLPERKENKHNFCFLPSLYFFPYDFFFSINILV